jgi:hypothetical protein
VRIYKDLDDGDSVPVGIQEAMAESLSSAFREKVATAFSILFEAGIESGKLSTRDLERILNDYYTVE